MSAPSAPEKASDERGSPLAAPPPRWDDALFTAFRVSFGALLRTWFRMRIEGPPPPAGACVLAANHTSFLDPLLLGAAQPRRSVYLMTEVVWRSPSLGWFYRWSRAIPLRPRGGNRDALRAAREVLRQGRQLAIFPEGGLSRDGQLMLGSPGAVSLVLQEGVPIVPVGIVGAHAAFPPGAAFPRLRQVTVRFGAPIAAKELDALGNGDRRERLRLATAAIMRRIAQLTGQVAREDVLAQRLG
jgi:1-acyl-sn-glycerol-3-phosphate acyltransferase